MVRGYNYVASSGRESTKPRVRMKLTEITDDLPVIYRDITILALKTMVFVL